MFHFFKKKETAKCAECMRLIKGDIWNLNGKSYCKECYNRNMTIIRQTGSEVENCFSQAKNTFTCAVCGKALPMKFHHKHSVCSACAEQNAALSKLKTAASAPPDDYLDDITYIQKINHTTVGAWHQYDVLLAARGYGWDMMKSWADYMAAADLEHISQVTAGQLGIQEQDITDSYLKNGGKCAQVPELEHEMGMLTIAGISKILLAPMKIVWINQTRVLRFFTIVDNYDLLLKYIETVIRRTFGTKNAMKLGKPLPEEK